MLVALKSVSNLGDSILSDLRRASRQKGNVDRTKEDRERFITVLGRLRLPHAGDYFAHCVVQLVDVRDLDLPVRQEPPDEPTEPELLRLVEIIATMYEIRG
jgi:hypothetical protein